MVLCRVQMLRHSPLYPCLTLTWSALPALPDLIGRLTSLREILASVAATQSTGLGR